MNPTIADILRQTLLVLLAIASVPCIILVPVWYYQFACYCDRIGDKAAAPISRAFIISLLAIAIMLICFAPSS